MASAYSTLENHGYYRNPTCISKIIDSDGNDIFRDTSEVAIYDEKAADTVVDMMTGVLTNGTARKLEWYKSTDTVAACKTGTTNESKDGWLCGFTPYYTVTVWVGYDQPKTLSNLYGATYPGNIWKESMLYLIEGLDTVEEFEKTDAYYEESVYTGDGNETYLPGRSDDEMLSDGYSVADYRNDRTIGEGLDVVINQMYALDKTDLNFPVNLQQLYNNGQAIINQIYSQKYTSELQGKLDQAFATLMSEAGY
jgi:membrane peptidoglycan carboxypeptidase